MPCYATGSAEGDANLKASEAWEAATVVTRVACELAKAVSKTKLSKMSESTRDWVKDHNLIDKKRKRK